MDSFTRRRLSSYCVFIVGALAATSCTGLLRRSQPTRRGDDQIQFSDQRGARRATPEMGALIDAAAVFHFRQALLQLNAIHNLSPSLPRLASLPQFAPLHRLMFRC